MKSKILALSFLFSCCLAKAATPECRDDDWLFKGNIKNEVIRYNQFLATLAGAKDPVGELNIFLKAHGLPLQLGAGNVKGLSGWLESKDEDPGGPVAIAFLKVMQTPKSSGLMFDTVYEFETSDSTKPLQKWSLPFEDFAIGLKGDDLIFQTNLVGVCGSKSRAVTVAVQPDNSFRVIEFKKPDANAGRSIEKCKGAKIVFKDSAYASCSEFTDIENKKKRILVWQMPMT